MDKIARIRQEAEELYAHIDKCIDTLIKARLNKDTDGEGKSLFQMEGLMVGTQQFLCWILDTLSEEPDSDDLEEAADKHIKSIDDGNDEWSLVDVKNAFIAGAKWQKAKDDEETADLMTIVALDAGQRARESYEKLPRYYGD